MPTATEVRKRFVKDEERRTVERYAISLEDMAALCLSNQRDRSWSTKSHRAFIRAARVLRAMLEEE